MTSEAYLDYNATTPLDPEVLKAMQPYFTENWGNASSFHRMGQKARHGVEEAREWIADVLEVEPGDLVFTSGGTEADNLAIKGVMRQIGDKRSHLVVSSIEHQAVLHAAQELEKSGYQITIVPVDGTGIVRLDELEKAITDKTALVSLMHVNNELGTVQPVKEAAKLAHAMGALFHTDAAQSFGKLPVQPESGGFDLVSLSGHKICGPKGVGALCIKKGVRLKAMTHGGHQEKNIRPGTENVAAIVGFGRAARLARERHEEESRRVRLLRDSLEEGLLELPGVRLNGHPERRAYNTANVSFEGLDGETLLMNLDLKNIYASTGSACTAGSVEPSHVLIAMGLSENLARAAIRFSLGRFTTGDEIEYALEEIPPIIERLRKSAVTK